ncbi:DgyrCDS2188 [Dimorphilus gyrociliatus]|uniref:DgyrCDS2188 n=1 Tax=Dimorphilus gyrociliatus TaxID=2664684 RepID=A0A7I8VBH1_9ANNE|nr:DgyrCDS2188 [Dimorphilus gyrociliatus]
MMNDLVEKSLIDYDIVMPWLIPVIQGFVQIERISVQQEDPSDKSKEIEVVIISRRSRYRAGTRYRRRGVDGEGNCANYVETEQIVKHGDHILSFAIIRGSVPVFWTQNGVKYRPPPKILEKDEENESAFKAHIESQKKIYDKLIAISLIEQSGREKVLHDEFLKQITKFNDESLDFIAFDFHEYCRGMHFENVSILTENIKQLTKDLQFFWKNNKKSLSKQKGIFRVNCVDCLDRTNVVQSCLAKIILEVQCRKILVLQPEEQLTANFKSKFQQMWANNGDAISRQYAGTAALKGDYTRTGERRFAGAFKDGVNSANRYYLSQFKDLSRQVMMDLMLGNIKADAMCNSTADLLDKQEDAEREAENLRSFIGHCTKMFICEPESIEGGWGFIDVDPGTGDPQQDDMDVVILLSQRSIFVVRYDDRTDNISKSQEIFIEDLLKVEVGTLKIRSSPIVMRLFYTSGDVEYFYTLRPAKVRLFNNIHLVIDTDEKALEALKVVTECLQAARSRFKHDIPILENRRIERKRSPPHYLKCRDHTSEKNLSLVECPMSRDPSYNDLNKRMNAIEEQSVSYQMNESEDCSVQISLGPISSSTDRYTSNPELSRNAGLLTAQSCHPNLDKKKSVSTDNLKNENTEDDNKTTESETQESSANSCENNKRKNLNSPLIKVSHSESSLKSHTIQTNEATKSILPFKKLGLSFTNNKENRQQILRDMAKSKVEKSQENYKELNCKVLLL